MEFFKRTIAQIQAQLASLTLSQRMTIILLLLIMVGAVLWMVQYAGQREMVPLLNQAFDEQSKTRIVEKLDGWDESYTIVGDRVMVPASRRRALIAKLSYAEAMPEDTSAGWARMLEDTDIWTPESVRENKKKIILQNELAATISSFPGVSGAEVFVNEGGKRRLMNVSPKATASVNVSLQPNHGPSRKMASAIAACVSGAIPNLARENVKVIMNGQLVPVVAEGQELSTEYLELKAKTEEYLRDKIIQVLPVPSALVQVDATPNITSRTMTKESYANEKEGSWLARIQTSDRAEESSMAERSQEPGLMANVPDQSQNEVAGNSQEQNSEEAEQSSVPFAGKTHVAEVTAPGGYSDVTVAVSVPIEHYVQMIKSETGSEDEPTQEQIQATIAREVPKIQRRVMPAVGLVSPQDDDRVVVDTYWAGGLELQAKQAELAAANIASAPMSVGSIANNYGKHIAVTALAVASLLMMLMMVRKATGPVDMTDEEAAAMMQQGPMPVDALSIDESNIMDEDGGASALNGMELDDKDVKTHQILQQIREMVTESPDIASNLISKWIMQDN